MNVDVPRSLFDRITRQIVFDLERGVRPWQKPWADHCARTYCRPRRHSGEAYKGINVLLLWNAASEGGYSHPVWMTYRQALEYGASVRKGEKGTTVIYTSELKTAKRDNDQEDEIRERIPIMQAYTVFNVEQIDGLPTRFAENAPPHLTDAKKLRDVDDFISQTGAWIMHGGTKCFYAEAADRIHIPFLTKFHDLKGYYATLAHELIHWTKHETRLKRNFGQKIFGDQGYAKEELVAEIGSAFLCADLGITPSVLEDHAAYIEFWLKALKDDKKLIFSAASWASRAVDYLTDIVGSRSTHNELPETVNTQIMQGPPALHS